MGAARGELARMFSALTSAHAFVVVLKRRSQRLTSSRRRCSSWGQERQSSFAAPRWLSWTTRSRCCGLLDEPKREQALSSGYDGFTIAARRPGEDTPSLLVRSALAHAQLGGQLAQRAVEPRSQAHQGIGKLALWDLLRALRERLAQPRADLADPAKVLADGQEPLAGRLRRLHRAHVQIGDVADVHQAEGNLRRAGHRTVDQPLDELDRRRGVRPQQRSKD